MSRASSILGESEQRSHATLTRFALREPDAGIEVLEEQLAELRELADLPSFLDQTIGVILPERPRDYRAFWDQARAVVALFRTTYLDHADRERLWREYSDLCQEVKELGQTEREARAASSAVSAERVRAFVREAGLWARGGQTGADLAEARTRLRKAMDLLKTAPLLYQDRQECFAAWREAADELDARREDIDSASFDSLMRELRDVGGEVSSGNTFEAAGLLRGLKADIQAAEVSREQRVLLREELHDLRGRLIRRIEARKAEQARLREERGRRQGAWRDRQTQRLDDLAEWHEQNDRRIERLKGEAQELEGQIASAWNDSWAEQAQGWVQAKYAKIRDLEARNEDLERQMAEIRQRLN